MCIKASSLAKMKGRSSNIEQKRIYIQYKREILHSSFDTVKFSFPKSYFFLFLVRFGSDLVTLHLSQNLIINFLSVAFSFNVIFI